MRKQLNRRLLSISWLLCIVLLPSGCGPRTLDPGLVLKNLALLQQAKNAVDSGDFTSAIPVLDECIGSQVLPLETLGEAVSLRARSLIKTGNLDRAKQDIDNLDQVVADMTQVFGLQYLYWKKKGDMAKAQSAWREALKINPSFKPPAD